ncbi:MAG: phosphopantetheine-binding protein [Flavobacteriales bacterium]|nr:acyl carrier protein [Ulvibacter sp.]|tara:strand:- start:4279 stop:4509 length:231 start_codon:yes stop_codon:yes gene_type:complete
MKEKVIKILTEIRPEFDFNTETDGFVSKGMLDSFDIISIVSDIEESFNIAIDGAQILPENFDSIQALVDLINKSNS